MIHKEGCKFPSEGRSVCPPLESKQAVTALTVVKLRLAEVKLCLVFGSAGSFYFTIVEPRATM